MRLLARSFILGLIGAICLVHLGRDVEAGAARAVDIESIHRFAAPFLTGQNELEGYQLGQRVQRHLKAEIAMTLAAGVTGSRAYAESAYRDLEWVIANRLETDGGLNWDGPINPYFFEVHQHWFLISSEMIRLALDDDRRSAELCPVQRRIWRYLIEENPARGDFYKHNRDHFGPFFAYRDVDRAGRFQTQAPFKGSYEIGAALWSFALHASSGWLALDDIEGGEVSGIGRMGAVAVGSYLDAMSAQVALPSSDLGFMEPNRRLWVRSILWTGDGWSGFDPHDWKYALHMQEGALLYQTLIGDRRFQEVVRAETDYLLDRIAPSGSVDGVPDGYGTPAYEYGEVLSVLGLSAIWFLADDPVLAVRCLRGGQSVARYVVESFPPQCTEDGALLLAGLSRVLEAQAMIGEVADGALDENGDLTPPSMLVWPNPSSGAIALRYPAGVRETGWARIVDPTGRERAKFSITGGVGGMGVARWEPVEGSQLPAGRYQVVVDIEGRRMSSSLILFR